MRDLAEAGLPERYRVNEALLPRPGPKETTQAVEPEPGLKLAHNDLLVVAGLRARIDKAEKDCGPPE